MSNPFIEPELSIKEQVMDLLPNLQILNNDQLIKESGKSDFAKTFSLSPVSHFKADNAKAVESIKREW